MDNTYIRGIEGTVDAAYLGDDYSIYATDVQGSTYSLIGDTLERDVSYTYSDFGETTVSGDTSNEICYTGAVRDAATGMYYMKARYYDPETGRFISQDTYRGEDSDAGTWHLYAYCSNNPINYTDPSGHFAIKIKQWMVAAAINFAFSCTPCGKTLSLMKTTINKGIIKLVRKNKTQRVNAEKEICKKIKEYTKKNSAYANEKKYKIIKKLKKFVKEGTARKVATKIVGTGFGAGVSKFISYVRNDISVFTSVGAFSVAVISYARYKTIYKDPLFVINV